MKKLSTAIALMMSVMIVFISCSTRDSNEIAEKKYFLEKVRNVLVVQAYADEFKGLSLKEKMLAWHLYRSSIAGRNIFFDQNHKYA